MDRTPHQYDHPRSASSANRPVASPSPSPSITTLLNDNSTQVAASLSPQDYFSRDVEPPRPSSSSSASGAFGTGRSEGTFHPLARETSPTLSRPTSWHSNGTRPGAGNASRTQPPAQMNVRITSMEGKSTSPVLANSETRALKRPRNEFDSNENFRNESGEMAPPPSKRETPQPVVQRRTSSSTPSASASPKLPTPSTVTKSNSPPPTTAPKVNKKLEPSIFNVEPIDEFTKEIGDWLWGFCQNLDWSVVEIEAKIGVLLDTTRRGRSRYHLPVPTEAILMDDSNLKFESNMTLNQHKSFNQLLNSRVEETAASAYPFAPVRYNHTREIDSFHAEFVPAVSGKKKIRMTRDQKDAAKIRCVEKIRLADMNIFSPKRLFDWRVSVNLEQPAPMPTSPPNLIRNKDRISYSHQLFTVDLTQVSTPPGRDKLGNPTIAPPVLHELEIEFKNAKILLIEAEKEANGQENLYLDMIQSFVNNVRMLIRNASEP